MKHRENDQLPLNQALEARGWYREQNRLYAPHKTFWTEGINNEYLPRHVLVTLYEKMGAALERMPEIEHLYPDKEHFRNWVEDTQSLVGTLRELLEEQQENSGQAAI